MEAMKGTIAFVNLYFGPGNDSYIGLIPIKKMEGPVSGVTAHIPKTPIVGEEKVIYCPIVTGHAANEIKMEALIAFDKVKAAHGLKFNKHYEVMGKDVREILRET